MLTTIDEKKEQQKKDRQIKNAIAFEKKERQKTAVKFWCEGWEMTISYTKRENGEVEFYCGEDICEYLFTTVKLNSLGEVISYKCDCSANNRLVKEFIAPLGFFFTKGN